VETNFFQVTEEDLKALQSSQEFFVIRYQEQRRFDNEMRRAEGQRLRQMQAEHQQLDRDLKNQALNIVRMRQKLMEKHQETIMQLQEIQQRVIDVQLLEVFIFIIYFEPF